MIAVIQRVQQASVHIEGQEVAHIGSGMVVLLGVGQGDREEDVAWLSQKIVSLRIYPDHEGKMNLSVKDICGEVLVVSQFTLLASIKKGTRPSFVDAARPEVARPLYERFVEAIQKDLEKPVKTGQFGADMQVGLVNDGPVTLVIDTKHKK